MSENKEQSIYDTALPKVVDKGDVVYVIGGTITENFLSELQSKNKPIDFRACVFPAEMTEEKLENSFTKSVLSGKLITVDDVDGIEPLKISDVYVKHAKGLESQFDTLAKFASVNIESKIKLKLTLRELFNSIKVGNEDLKAETLEALESLIDADPVLLTSVQPEKKITDLVMSPFESANTAYKDIKKIELLGRFTDAVQTISLVARDILLGKIKSLELIDEAVLPQEDRTNINNLVSNLPIVTEHRSLFSATLAFLGIKKRTNTKVLMNKSDRTDTYSRSKKFQTCSSLPPFISSSKKRTKKERRNSTTSLALAPFDNTSILDDGCFTSFEKVLNQLNPNHSGLGLPEVDVQETSEEFSDVEQALEDSNERLNNVIRNLKEELIEVEKSKRLERERGNIYKQQADNYKCTVDNQAQQILAYSNEIDEFRQQLYALHTYLQTKEAEIRRLTVENGVLKEDLNGLFNLLDSMQKKQDELAKNLQEAQNLLNQKTRQAPESVKEAIRNRKGKNAAVVFDEREESILLGVESAKEQIETLKEKLAGKNSHLVADQLNIASRKLKTTEILYKSALKLIQKKDKHIEKDQNKIDKLLKFQKTIVSKYLAHLTEKPDDSDNIEFEDNELQKEVDNLKNLNSELEASVQELNSEVEKLKKANATLEAENTEVKKRLEGKEQTLAVKIEQSIGFFNLPKSRTGPSQEEYDELKKEMEDLQRKYKLLNGDGLMRYMLGTKTFKERVNSTRKRPRHSSSFNQGLRTGSTTPTNRRRN
jgi:hypothetical protein